MLSKCKDEMQNIRDVEGNFIMSTNAGEKELDKEGDWKEWGKAYLDETALTNIVSISYMVKKGFHVVFDSDKENCFYVIEPKNDKVI